ncbi:TOBE domain-containing protein [Streptomyces sannanensis]|uniref:TOBE domain-containing protein n=1 Tax=Streptomyces sannanensis TaxID=285536 RepID=A0ABP6SCB5_9ACTN
MSLSIRNRLRGTVVSVSIGPAMATVKVRLDGGQEITAAVTAEAVADLGLAADSRVDALAKAGAVALATAAVKGLSIRNQLPGTVTSVTSGVAMATVRVAVAGAELTAAITKDAVDELALAEGVPVVSLIKATEISLANAA